MNVSLSHSCSSNISLFFEFIQKLRRLLHLFNKLLPLPYTDKPELLRVVYVLHIYKVKNAVSFNTDATDARDLLPALLWGRVNCMRNRLLMHFHDLIMKPVRR